MTNQSDTEAVLTIEDEAIRFYTDCVEAYLEGAASGLNPYVEWKLQQLLAQAGPAPLLLDIGCGHGRLARYAPGLGASHYIGVDASEPILDLARSVFNGFPQIEFRHGNILSLSKALEEKADVCVSSYVLSHISRARIDEAIREIRAVMRIGATGLLEFIYGDEEIVVTSQELPHVPQGYRLGNTAWTADMLVPHFETNGFKLREDPYIEFHGITLIVEAI